MERSTNKQIQHYRYKIAMLSDYKKKLNKELAKVTEQLSFYAKELENISQ